MERSLETYLARRAPRPFDKKTVRLLALLTDRLCGVPLQKTRPKRPLSFRQKATAWLLSVFFSGFSLFVLFFATLWL